MNPSLQIFAEESRAFLERVFSSFGSPDFSSFSKEEKVGLAIWCPTRLDYDRFF